MNFWVSFLHAFAYVNVGHLKVGTFCDQVGGVTMTKLVLPQALIIDHLYTGTLEWHETEVVWQKPPYWYK